MKKFDIIYGFIIAASLTLVGCKKFIDVPPPVTSTNANIVYSNDATATSVIIGIYSQLSTGSFLSGRNGLSLYAGLSADEFEIATNPSDVTISQYYKNNISPQTPFSFWGELYSYIYKTNDVIQNLQNAGGVTEKVKKQLQGEAYFMRALCYFYLVNLFGDVPLAVQTDYTINSKLPRAPTSDVYALMVSDLETAQELLNVEYVGGNSTTPINERLRVNKTAASALLARVYLFQKNYANAEQMASTVITNTAVYDTVALNNVFIKNNKEAIWQLQPVEAGVNTRDATLFVLPSNGPNPYANFVWLNEGLINTFEPGDRRKTSWVNNVSVPSGTYFYPYKYKISVSGAPVTEYQTVLRLGEQYLIRAEARVQQDKFTDGLADLNVIRKRAGLLNYAGPMDKQSILDAILHERRVELFSENGQRWLDLKRTGKIDEVMNIATPQKGGAWKKEAALYPIKQYELSSDPNLVQNPGY